MILATRRAFAGASRWLGMRPSRPLLRKIRGQRSGSLNRKSVRCWSSAVTSAIPGPSRKVGCDSIRARHSCREATAAPRSSSGSRTRVCCWRRCGSKTDWPCPRMGSCMRLKSRHSRTGSRPGRSGQARQLPWQRQRRRRCNRSRRLCPTTASCRSRSQLWLRADSLALSDGEPVYVWPDQSGHARDMSATKGVRSRRRGNAGPIRPRKHAAQAARRAVRHEHGTGVISRQPGRRFAATRR